ncbi:MAG: helix-turn-helix domain-containing protein [Sciscionella sp.]
MTVAGLTEVLQRHRVGLSDAEVVAELDAALSAASDAGATPLSTGETDFLRTHAGPHAASAIDTRSPGRERTERGRAITQRLADAIAGSWSIAETAQLLGVDRSRISHRLKTGTLWAFSLGRHRRIPRWQITAAGETLPGLAVVVPAIPAGLDPQALDAFVHTAQPDFTDQTPLAYLAAGGDPALVAGFVADLGRW